MGAQEQIAIDLYEEVMGYRIKHSLTALQFTQMMEVNSHLVRNLRDGACIRTSTIDKIRSGMRANDSDWVWP